MSTFDYENNPAGEEPRPVDPIPEPEQPSRQSYVPPVPPRQEAAAPYHGAGTGRRESPYANSPYASSPYVNRYEQQEQPRYTYQPQYEQQPQYTPPQPKPKKQRKPGLWKRIAAVAAAVAVVVGSCAVTAGIVNSHWESRMNQVETRFADQIQGLQKQIDAGARTTVGGIVVPGEGMTPSQVYAGNVDSVVAISSTVRGTTMYGQSTEGTATGSGFILTADGYVVTNSHVVEGATAVSVIMHDGSEHKAAIVGNDSANDVAVLKIEAENLPAATIGSSDELVIGDMVVAIGNPLGTLNATQTVGYVSGKDRDVTTEGSIISMIQTDAAINSGNSGGPLFNMRGEVVGITTAKYSGTTGSGASIEGIGFAIPIDDVYGIITDLIDYGYVTGAYLGITVTNTDEESASMFGLPTGAYVMDVVEGGCADLAGMQPKDIIIDLGGHKVTGITTLTRALRNFKAGDTTTVTVIRGGSQLVLDITLDEKPQSVEPVIPEGEGQMPSEGSPEEWFEYFRRYFGD